MAQLKKFDLEANNRLDGCSLCVVRKGSENSLLRNVKSNTGRYYVFAIVTIET